MEISLLQAIALGILAFVAGLDMFNGLTHLHRPVVLGPLVGLSSVICIPAFLPAARWNWCGWGWRRWRALSPQT